MGFKIFRSGLIPVVTIFAATTQILSAQTSSEQTDSLVRLVKAKSIELIERDGQAFRKTVQPTFLHNGTYLLCDSALWDVEKSVINCMGGVHLIQDETVLTSDSLNYDISGNVAMFRGSLVQMRNKEENILRTRYLDYNTRDSMAVFHGGAAMKSEDDQIIESMEGSYFNSKGLFIFIGEVNMYTDSIRIKTDRLTYNSKSDFADFVSPIDFWRGGNMLSANLGWYDKRRETFFFHDSVHGLSRDQEVWSDSLFFYKNTNDILLLGDAQVLDTTRNVTGMADYILYQDSLSRITMMRDAAVALSTIRDEKQDTVYVGSDKFIYQSVRKCDVPEAEIQSAQVRIKDMNVDAVAQYRSQAAEAAKRAAENALAEKNRNHARRAAMSSSPQEAAQGPDTTAGAVQTAADTVATDSIMADSLVVTTEPDTSKIGFVSAIGKVRVFRTDMQARCDSLLYCDLDSIARMYVNPIIWNEETRQYTSDSTFIRISGAGMEKASLISNAFIVAQEDSLHYNQIRAAEVAAYFDSTSALSRFDALGGASAIFFLEEEETLATVNKVESRILSASMKDGELDQVHYFEKPNNDAYPIVQLSSGEQILKGFAWMPQMRPQSRLDITGRQVRDTERKEYESRPGTRYLQTERFFPGLIAGLTAPAPASVPASAVATADSSAGPAVNQFETVQTGQSQTDTESLQEAVAGQEEVQQQEVFMTDAELRRAMRTARRDARWAELDRRDAEKLARRERIQSEKAARKAAKEAERQAKQDAKDAAKLQKYIEYYQKQKVRHERKQQSFPAGKRP